MGRHAGVGGEPPARTSKADVSSTPRTSQHGHLDRCPAQSPAATASLSLLPSQCALTIAGFYYICFDRVTGAVDGYYFDPRSNPFQRLQLRRSAPSSGVMSLGACESL